MKKFYDWIAKRFFSSRQDNLLTLADRDILPAEPALFIGREREFQKMSELFEKIPNGKGQIWLLSGDAGMGKSALIQKFIEEKLMQERSKVVLAKGACDEDLSGSVSLIPVVEAFKSIMRNEGLQEKQGNLVSQFIFAGLKFTPILGELISVLETTSDMYRAFERYLGDKESLQIESLKMNRETLYYDMTSTLKKIAQHYTLVLYLENLHWCDRSTMGFLSFLAKRIGDSPILLILPFRPTDVKTENPDWLKLLDDFHRYEMASEIEVCPFQEPEVAEFLSRRFPGHEFPASFVKTMAHDTGGVPLFLVEASSLLVEEGTVAQKQGKWVLTQEREIQIPKTVEAVIQERLRRLEEKMGSGIKDALKRASVQGELFFSDILLKLTEEMNWNELSIDDYLKKVADIHQLIRNLSPEEKSGLQVSSAGTSYQFAHALYHKSLYKELTDAQRSRLHHMVGDILEETNKNKPESVASQLVFHFNLGKGYAKVAHYCHLAALHEKKKYSVDEAISYCKQGISALQLLENLSEKEQVSQICLFTLLGSCHAYRGELENARKAYEEALKIAEALVDLDHLPEIFYRLSRVERQLGRIREARGNLERGLDFCETQKEWKVRLLDELGEIYMTLSKWSEAEKALLEAIEMAGAEEDKSLQGMLISDLAKLREKEGKWLQALELYEKCHALHADGMDLIGKGKSLAGIARIYRKQGRWKESSAKYQEALSCFKEAHYREGEVRTRLDIGIITIKEGEWQKGAEIFQECHAAYQDMGHWLGIAKSLNLMGYALRKLSRYQEAEQYHKESLAVNENVGNEEGKALCLENLSLISMKHAHWTQAREQIEKALEIWERLQSPVNKSVTLAYLGCCLMKQNKFQEAYECFQQSMALKKELNDPEGEAHLLDNIGMIHFCQGQWNEAIHALKKSLEIRDRLGIVCPKAITLSTLGHVYRKQARFEEAMAQYQASYEINQKTGDLEGVAFVYENMGVAHLDNNRFEEAMDNLSKSLRIREKMEDRPGCAPLYDRLGKLYRKQGAYEHAWENLDKALKIKEEINDLWGKAYTLNELGRLYYVQDLFEKASESFQASLDIRRQVGDLYGQAKTLNNLGEVLLKQAKPVLAMEHFSQSMDLKNELLDIRGLAFTHYDIAQAYLLLNRTDKAIDNFLKSHGYWQKMNMQSKMAEIQKYLGDLYSREGKKTEAKKAYKEALMYYQTKDPAMTSAIENQIEEME